MHTEGHMDNVFQTQFYALQSYIGMFHESHDPFMKQTSAEKRACPVAVN